MCTCYLKTEAVEDELVKEIEELEKDIEVKKEKDATEEVISTVEYKILDFDKKLVL